MSAGINSKTNESQDAKEPNADSIAMLFANLAKSDSIKRLFTFTLTAAKELSTSKQALDQLMDCFVRGAEKKWNSNADYDYLAYLFADLSKVSHPL